MNVVILHGQNHQGCTYHLAHHLLNKLNLPDVTLNEFYFSNQAGCLGCNQCFYKGEAHCPHTKVIQPIVAAIDAADLVILASPCYCMGMTGSLKNFLDHLAYLWMAHRPHPEMFHKVGIVLSTAGGAGASKVTKALSEHLLFWGIPRVYSYPLIVNAANWESISPKIYKKMERQINQLSPRIRHQLKQPRPTIKPRLIYKLMQLNQKSNTWNPLDQKHWVQFGLLAQSNPWHK